MKQTTETLMKSQIARPYVDAALKLLLWDPDMTFDPAASSTRLSSLYDQKSHFCHFQPNQICLEPQNTPDFQNETNTSFKVLVLKTIF